MIISLNVWGNERALIMFKKILKLGRQALWLKNRDYLFEKHELRVLFWECTLNCNFFCQHCGSRAGKKCFEETLSTQEIKNAFSDVATNFKPERIFIAITGGEPLLRADLFEVMEYAKSLGFNWGVISNGFLVTDEIIKKAKKAGMDTADISIDGIGEVHDAFRNTPQAYDHAIKAVKLYQKANFLKVLRISSTINKKNINDLEKMYQTFSKLGIDEWRLICVDPIGRAADNKNILLNKDDYDRIFNFIIKKRRSEGKLKVTAACQHFLGDKFEDEVRDHFFYCATGINVGSILHNGDIFVCPNVPRRDDLIQGNVKKDSFSKVWNEKFEFFRNKERTACSECQACEHWDECLGGSFHSWNFEENKQNICLMRKEKNNEKS